MSKMSEIVIELDECERIMERVLRTVAQYIEDYHEAPPALLLGPHEYVHVRQIDIIRGFPRYDKNGIPTMTPDIAKRWEELLHKSWRLGQLQIFPKTTPGVECGITEQLAYYLAAKGERVYEVKPFPIKPHHSH